MFEIFNGEKIKSKEEYDYVYVKNNEYYNFESFDKKAVFVLPPTPSRNYTIHFSDKADSLKWFPVIIHRNGKLIMGEGENMVCDIPNIFFKMIYVGQRVGWFVGPDTQFLRGNNDIKRLHSS